MADKKMTIREGFEKARAVFAEMGDAEMVAFFDGRIEQVAKKNASERKPTPKQVENEGVKSAIAEWMEHDVLYACADVAKQCPACAELSVQRVSALLTQMGKAGIVNVSEDKRKKFYALAD